MRIERQIVMAVFYVRYVFEPPYQSPEILAGLGEDDIGQNSRKKTGNGAKSKTKTGRAA
jgi:hypothetical protein